MTLEQRFIVVVFVFFFLGVVMGVAARASNKSKGKPMTFRHKLGTKVRCKITGYTGMIIGRTEWLYACRRYVVQARELKDGKPVDAINCDEDQLDILEEVAVPHVVKDTGGPTMESPRPRETSR